MEGPKAFLEREATYQLSVINPGTASAQQVELVAYLPSGLKFVNANNAGYYDDTNRTVHWRLEDFPLMRRERRTGYIAVEAGQHAIKLRGTAQKGLSVEKEQPVLVEGIAALHSRWRPTNPIQLNGTTTYDIQVANKDRRHRATFA